MKSFTLPLFYFLILFIILLIALYFIGKQIYLTQNFEQILKTLKNRTNLSKNSSEDFYKLGQLYLRKKNYTNAILALQRSLKCWDFNDILGLASLYNTIGFMYFTLKDYDYSIYYYRKALYLVPDYQITLLNLAVTYEKLNMFKEAYNLYLKISFYNPNNKFALNKINNLQNKVYN